MIPALIIYDLISRYRALQQRTLLSLERGVKRIHHSIESILSRAVGGSIITTSILWMIALSGMALLLAFTMACRCRKVDVIADWATPCAQSATPCAA